MAIFDININNISSLFNVQINCSRGHPPPTMIHSRDGKMIKIIKVLSSPLAAGVVVVARCRCDTHIVILVFAGNSSTGAGAGAGAGAPHTENLITQ